MARKKDWDDVAAKQFANLSWEEKEDWNDLRDKTSKRTLH